MKKSNKKIENKGLYIVLICVFLALIIFFSLRAYNHYNDFRSHRNYFRQQNQQIESWMTVHLVTRNFNITDREISSTLRINDSFSSQRLTIEEICKKKRLNCTEVINTLNSLR